MPIAAPDCTNNYPVYTCPLTGRIAVLWAGAGIVVYLPMPGESVYVDRLKSEDICSISAQLFLDFYTQTGETAMIECWSADAQLPNGGTNV